MIKTIDIINKLEDKKYADMIKQVNIPDFYKCMAQFSGIGISRLSDDRIIEYLTTWAESKYRFYQMLGNKLRLDTPFVYKNEKENYKDEYKELMKKFPVYALWLEAFEEHKKNDIGRLEYNSVRYKLKELFPSFNYEKSTITHLFKSQLNAPDDLVTGLGRIYENKEVIATHTLSIDPVDIMLASENPYEWDSCYRLELQRSDSHADGCMGAVLDTSSLISYVWSSEGEYNMYDSFKFKKIRYYRIRQWINVSDNWGAVHFASAYPNRDGYDGELNKQLRDVVEAVIAKHMKVDNVWRKNETFNPKGWNEYIAQIERGIQYGYNEFEEDYIWLNNTIIPRVDEETTEKDIVYINVYNRHYRCPCGCDYEVYPSDEAMDPEDAYDGDTCYNGEGFCAENFYVYEEEEEPLWCEWCDSDCEQGLKEYDCCEHEACPIWRKTHKPCSINPQEIECDRADQVSTYEDDDGITRCHANCADCEGCYYWERRDIYEKKDKEDE